MSNSEIHLIIGVLGAIVFIGFLLYIREKNRRAAQTEIFGKPVTFKEGIRLTWTNIKDQFQSFYRNMIKRFWS